MQFQKKLKIVFLKRNFGGEEMCIKKSTTVAIQLFKKSSISWWEFFFLNVIF